MKFIDTHTHLYLPEFKQDREEMLKRATEVGISKILLPNVDLENIPQIKAIKNTRLVPIYAAMGLHPTSVKVDYKNTLKLIYDELLKGDYVAIGEIGIDLYWDKSREAEQTDAFKQQIAWAKALQLPIIIHARNSFDEIFAVMDELWSPELKGVFHCFSGTEHEALKIIHDYKFMLGIGGVLTFKNSGLKKEIQPIGLEHMVLETDAPYLAPVPYRGKRNESAYIPIIAQHLAEVKNCKVQKVAEITTANAQQLFKI